MSTTKDNLRLSTTDPLSLSTKDKNKLKYMFSFAPRIIIMDFYNIYCNYINFEKNKIFTENSFKECLLKIINSSNKQNELFIISKPIFEVSDETIRSFTKKYNNINYIIVVDNNDIKSLNRERDDYVCIILNFLLETDSKKSIIITNDKLSNYKILIKNVKPFTIKIFNGDTSKEIKINEEYINDIYLKITQKQFKPNRKSFKFLK